MNYVMKSTFQILCLILSTSCASSSIAGMTYMDPLIQKPLEYLRGEDPCNPLYWYPRQIPEYCYKKVENPEIPKPLPPLSLPLPVPLPPPIPLPPMPVSMPAPMPMPIPMYTMPMFPPMPQFIPPPAPVFPLPVPQVPVPQIPYGVPVQSRMMSMPAPFPYPHQSMPPIAQQAGLVPGIPGLVSPDGGINILPFSDAYSDLLEKHKQKVIRKKLQKVLDDYKDYPRRKKHRKYRGRNW